MTKDEGLAAVNELARPIDLADLTARGILKKSGAWYEVRKAEELPKDARTQAVASSTTTTGMMKLKFKNSTNKRARALRQKIVGS